MKVCLINPQDPLDEDGLWDEPLGLLYLGAVLHENGVDVDVVDMNFHKGLGELRHHEADVYGLYCSSGILTSALKTNDFLKTTFPDSLRIVGGPHATCLPNQMLKHFDKVVVGEGERAILEALDTNKKIIMCPPIENLDTLPFPMRELVPIKKYHRRVDGRISTGMITARGCPYGCSFCSKVWGHTVRFRSAENIIAEATEIKNRYDIHALSIRDDTFTLNKKRLHKILDGFEQLDLAWCCLTRVDQVDEKTLLRMKEVGCTRIVYGIESGSQKILDLLRKGTTVEQNARAIELTKKVGIPVKTSIIIGSPGETQETVDASIRFIEEHRPDEQIVCTFTPYPGSAVWDNPDLFNVKILHRRIDEYAAVGAGMKGNVVMETKEMNAQEIADAHERVLTHFRGLGIIKN